MRKVEVVVLRLAPYEVELGGDDKGRNVKDEMRKGKTEAFGNHDGITSEGKRAKASGTRRVWLGQVRSRDGQDCLEKGVYLIVAGRYEGSARSGGLQPRLAGYGKNMAMRTPGLRSRHNREGKEEDDGLRVTAWR